MKIAKEGGHLKLTQGSDDNKNIVGIVLQHIDQSVRHTSVCLLETLEGNKRKM